jgi:hypothetical protein
MTDWTPEEDEAFNEVERHSNLGKQILRGIEGQPYHFEKREWVGLTDDEIFEIHKQVDSMQYLTFGHAVEAKLKEKNT